VPTNIDSKIVTELLRTKMLESAALAITMKNYSWYSKFCVKF